MASNLGIAVSSQFRSAFTALGYSFEATGMKGTATRGIADCIAAEAPYPSQPGPLGRAVSA